MIHPLPWDIRTNAAEYSVIVDATGTEVLLAFGDDPQTSRAVAEFVVRSLLSYSPRSFPSASEEFENSIQIGRGARQRLG